MPDARRGKPPQPPSPPPGPGISSPPSPSGGFHGREGDPKLVDAPHQIAEEPFAYGRVPIQNPLHRPRPRAVRPWPEPFLHEILEPDVHDVEPRARIEGVGVLAEIVE